VYNFNIHSAARLTVLELNLFNTAFTAMIKPDVMLGSVTSLHRNHAYRTYRVSTSFLLGYYASMAITAGTKRLKVKAFPYSIPSVGPGADPGVQAVSSQVTVSHPPGGRLPLLSARPAVTSPAAEHHRPLAGTKLYCLVTEAHRCKQLAQGCYAALPRVGFEPATY